MVFNFSLTQELSLFFFNARGPGQLCFCNFSFLTESDPYFSAGFKKQSVFRALAVSTNYILTFSHKRKNDIVLL